MNTVSSQHNPFSKTQFDNGLRVVFSPVESINSSTVLVLVGAGSKNEKKSINGISHFIEHMCFKGTENRPNPLEIAKEIDGIGGDFNAFTGKEYTGYYVKADSSHLDLVVELASDIFWNSIFNEEEIEKERGVILEERKMIKDTPIRYVEDLWEKLLYGNQPAGWDIIGTKNSILNLQREDLLKYFNSHYSASNTVISVAGSSEFEKVENIAGKYLGNTTRQEQSGSKEEAPISKKEVVETQKRPQTLSFKKNTQQTHLGVGVRGYNLFHKYRYAQALLATILGGNMSSRLFQKIREERGLAYYVRTTAEANPDTGFIVTLAGVDNKKISKTVSLILDEYKKVRDEGIKDEELRMAKDYMKGKILLSLEGSDEISSFYGVQELIEEEIVSPQEKIERLEKVTSQDIKEAAQHIFKNEGLNLVQIGPKSFDSSILKL